MVKAAVVVGADWLNANPQLVFGAQVLLLEAIILGCLFLAGLRMRSK